MPHSPEKYVHDMLSSCCFLIDFTADRTEHDYAADRGFRSAVERELQIICEALLQLARNSPDVASQIDEYRRIINFRHVLVHGYGSLNPRTVWSIVEDKLPVLRSQLEALLRRLDAE